MLLSLVQILDFLHGAHTKCPASSRAYSAQIERGTPISTKESKVEMIRQAPRGSRERRSGEVEANWGYQRNVLFELVG